MSGILLDPEFYEDIISFRKLIGDLFMDKVKRNGDHFEVGIILRWNWGSFKGWGSFWGLYSTLYHNTCLQFVLIWNY